VLSKMDNKKVDADGNVFELESRYREWWPVQGATALISRLGAVTALEVATKEGALSKMDNKNV